MVQYFSPEVDLQSGPPGDEHRAMGIGLVLALIAALAYGASDFVGGTGSRQHSPWGGVLIGQVCGAALMIACGLLASADPRAVDFAWALLAGAGSATGSIFLYRGSPAVGWDWSPRCPRSAPPCCRCWSASLSANGPPGSPGSASSSPCLASGSSPAGPRRRPQARKPRS